MRRLLPLALCLLFCLLATSASAERFQSYEDRNGQPPDKYDPDVLGEIENLEKHLREKVSCGGWINGDALETMSGTNITSVFGAPGRDLLGDPFANLPSGMAQRGEFTYPEDVHGYMSACSIYNPKYNPDKLCMIGEKKATPKQCKELYDKLLQMKADYPNDPNYEPEKITACEHEFIVPECLDDTYECHGEDCRCGVVKIYEDWGGGAMLVGTQKASPNPTTDECNTGTNITYPTCHYEFDDAGNLVLIMDSPMKYEISVASFYRHYGPISDMEELPKQVTMSGFTVLGEGGMEQKVASDCYEYYIEKDARNKVAPPWNLRCEVYETDDSDFDPAEPDKNKNTPEWKNDNFPQKTWIEPNTSQSPYLPNQLNLPRAAREEMDPWINDTETSISLLDMQENLPPDQRVVDPDDLSPNLNAAPQEVITAGRTRERGRTDPYDDATDPLMSTIYPSPDFLEHRDVVRWWDQQQAFLKGVERIPAIHLILPARYGVGLDLQDPLLKMATKTIVQPSGVVDIELRAGDDIFGGLIASLQNSSLLVPKEVRIPVIVPLVSEPELDNLIFEWKEWQVRFDQGGSADQLIAKLTAYRDQVRNVRLLRGAVAGYLSDALQVQRDVRGFFAQWYLANANALASWSKDASIRQMILEQWRNTMSEFIRLHDRCELLWCSNSRYSLPIYSLLDPWLPGRPQLSSVLSDPDYSLRGIAWTHYPDIVADFSTLKLPSEEFYLPAIEVTQIPLKLPYPPNGPGSVPDAGSYPDIPMIDPADLVPTSKIFEDYKAPNVKTPVLDSRHYIPTNPGTNNMTQVLAKLTAINTIVTRAADNYCAFSNSVTGRDAQSRKIAHAEFDLRERIARLFARRAPLWKQDYQGRTERIGQEKPTCVDDVNCDRLYPETTKSFQWQVDAPEDSAKTLTPSYNDLRTKVLPQDQSKSPYAIPWDTLKRYLLPELDKPKQNIPPLEIRLGIPPESPSSNTTSSAPTGP